MDRFRKDRFDFSLKCLLNRYSGPELAKNLALKNGSFGHKLLFNNDAFISQAAKAYVQGNPRNSIRSMELEIS